MSFDVKNRIHKGEIVFYSPHKGHRDYCLMLVTFVGNESLEGVVYAYNGHTTTASHKGGVRHESDPIWEDPIRVGALIEDGDSGCFVEHPYSALLKQLAVRVEALEQARVAPASSGALEIAPPRRKKSKSELNEESVIDQSFREPTVELTPEQKELRAAALQEALSGIGS